MIMKMNKMWSGSWTVVLCLTLIMGMAAGLCPGQCQCHDDTLRTDCASADLLVVPIFLNPEIKHLDIHGNKIRKLEDALHFYSALEGLDFSENRLQHLGKGQFVSQQQLQFLNLSHNLVTSLHAGGFKGPRALQTLDLSHNALSSLEEGAFKGLNSLVELWLGDNLIEEIAPGSFNGLGRLRLLHLERNRLTAVSAEWQAPLQNLRFLYASQNQLESLGPDSFKTLAALQVLELRANGLKDVDEAAFRACRSVDTLDLSENDLSFVPTTALSQLSSLQDLSLSANPIRELADDAFATLIDLETLRLNEMAELRSVAGHAFLAAGKLRHLELEANPQLQPLPWGVFDTNVLLQEVRFRGNSWKTLSHKQVPLRSLRALLVEGLPLHCNCSVTWLWELYEWSQNGTSATDRLYVDAVRCASVASPPPPDEAGSRRAGEQASAMRAGGRAGDPLSKMAPSQLSCEPHASAEALMTAVSGALLATVLLLACVALAAYRCRVSRLRARSSSYGGASCIMHIKDDTMVYKGSSLLLQRPAPGYLSASAASSAAAHTRLQLQSSSGSSSTGVYSMSTTLGSPTHSNEPFYEVPKYDKRGGDDDDDDDDRDRDREEAKYYIGSELWDTPAKAAALGHCYTNQLPAAAFHQMAKPSGLAAAGSQGSPQSTTTTATTTACGSLGSSSNSSTVSGKNRQFYSPGLSHRQFYPAQQQQQQQQQQYFSPQLAGKTLVQQQQQLLQPLSARKSTGSEGRRKKTPTKRLRSAPLAADDQLMRPGTAVQGQSGTLNLYV